MTKSLTLFCDLKNLALRTINLLACMLLVGGAFAFTPNDDCFTKELDVVNNGDCPVKLYHWLDSGDVYITDIAPGATHGVSNTAGETYRVINTNPDWQNLLFDEHTTLSSDCNQTWNVNPQYCSPCPTKKLNVVNDGNCPVKLYQWLDSGDVYVTDIAPGATHGVSNNAGETYRVINTNPDWQNLLFDEHTTLTSDCNQTWNVNPQYCAPTVCTGDISTIQLNTQNGLINITDGATITTCDIAGNVSLRALVSGAHESLQFSVSGTANFSNTENYETYDSHEFNATTGNYTVETTLFSDANLGGTLCDTYTINFTIADCVVVVDNDNDGIPADEDCDDNDATVPTTVGSTCNDNDATTEDDKILADGCTCEGTEVIVVVVVNGGTLEGGPFEFCVDGDADFVSGITLTGNEGANNSWVITDDQGNILGLPPMPGVVDFDGAGAGVCFIYNVSYDEITGLEAGANIADFGGNFDLSNGISVTRLTTGGVCPDPVVIPTVSIDDVTVNEEDGTASLTISLDQPATTDVTVTYTTSDNTAALDTDYVGTTSTVTIPAGSTSVIVTFPITDDAAPESTEDFGVTLTSPNGATIADGVGTVTILDTDEATAPNTCDAEYSVSGDAITITGLDDEMNMVQILDANWNVLYECNSWTVPCDVTAVFDNLPAGSYVVSIQTTDAVWNQICNITESFEIGGDISPCANTITESGDIGGAQTGCGSFDPTTLTSIAPASGGSGTLEYLWLSSTNGCPGSVSQAIEGATGETYNPGVLTETTYFRRCSRRVPCEAWFGVGETNCIKVTVNESGTPGDACDDNNPDTSNDVILADGCTCAGATAPDTDPNSNISINDVVLNEEDGTATLVVSIDQVLGSDLTIDYTSDNGSADASDFTPANGTVTIPAGSLTGTITFPILDDSAPESTEDFNVILSNPSAGTILDGIGVVTILDTDEAAPVATDCSAAYSVNDATLTVTGLVQPIVMVQILDMNWEVLTGCSTWETACNTTEIFSNLAPGDYMVSIQTSDAAWNQICNITESFTIEHADNGGDCISTATSNLVCNGADDTFTVDVTVTGTNTGTWEGLLGGQTIFGAYNETVTFGPFPNNSGSTISGWFKDAVDTNCMVDFTVTAPRNCDDVVIPGDDDVVPGDDDVVVVPGDCAVTYVVSSDAITVSNLTDPVVAVKVLDENFNVAYECNAWSTACNATEVIDILAPGSYFLQVQTYDAAWINICELFEEFTIEGNLTADDADGDGVLAADDCDDNDASVPATVGSSCDDNNASTENDVILADGCSCEGTPTIDLTCNVGVTTDGSQIVVTGLNAPIVSAKVIDANWLYVYECGTLLDVACNATEVIEGLPAATYFVSVQTYDAAWNTICNEWIEVVIEDNEVVTVIDNDNDGVPAADDCDDNNASVPTAMGSACDDNNANTENDVILSDGCTCAGIPVEIISCQDEMIAYYSLDNCLSNTDGENANYNDFTADDINFAGYNNVTAGNIARANGNHSCTPGVNSPAMCIGTANDCSMDASTWDAYALSFDITVDAAQTGAITGFEFQEKAPTQFDWIGGASGDNNFTTKYAVRVLKDGVTVFEEYNINTTNDWTTETFNFAGNTDFQVAGTATYTFQLRSYCRTGNGATTSVWDVDEFKVFGGACNGSTNNTNASICIERDVTDVTNCSTGVDYGFYFRTAEYSEIYNWVSAELVEYDNGTATLSGTVVNANDSNIGFDVEVNLTGRTNSPNAEGTKGHECLSPETNNFYYYSDFSGTISGNNNIAGLSFAIETLGNSFQVGFGAHATGNNLDFGASGWWTAVQTSAASNGTSFTSEVGRGDFNITLSGGYSDCLNNVIPRIANPNTTNTALAVKTALNTATTTVDDMISEVAKVANFSIFPNPATEYINIEVSEFAGQDVQVSVFNAIGVQTYNNNISDLNDNVISIDLTQHVSGAYTVIFQADGKVTTKKFIVTKQ